MKLCNSDMIELIRYLDRCEDAKPIAIKGRSTELALLACTHILYELNTKLKKKYREYSHNLHYKIKLNVSQGAALVFLYLTLGSDSIFIQNLIGKIDKSI